MRTVLLVPRRPGFPERDRVWEWLRPWWDEHLPELELFEGDHLDGPFNRGAAINVAAEKAGPFDVAFVIDADVILDPRQVRAAIAVAHGTGGPCLAYVHRHHLSREGSERILDGFRGDWRPLVKSTFDDSCSSAYAVTGRLFEECHGFDELFSGWGWEDVAFRVATEVLADAELVKIFGPLWHLWHVVSSGNNPAEPTFVANRARGDLYRAARAAWDRDAVLDLVTEQDDRRLAGTLEGAR